MTHLRKMMLEELERRNYAQTTIEFYLLAVAEFSLHFRRPRCGEKITVTPKEFKTFEFFTRNAERTISRDELLNEVWGYQNYPCTRTVDNHILKLRQKLEIDPSHPVALSYSTRPGL